MPDRAFKISSLSDLSLFFFVLAGEVEVGCVSFVAPICLDERSDGSCV